MISFESFCSDFPRYVFFEEDNVVFCISRSDGSLKELCVLNVAYTEFDHLIDCFPFRYNVSVSFPPESDLLADNCFVDLNYHYCDQFLGYRRFYYEGESLNQKEQEKVIKYVSDRKY